MAINRTLTLGVIVATLLVSAGIARGQLGSPFSGKLEPVSDGSVTAPTGTGILYAVLDYYPEGPKLMVNGTFDGMNAAATVAHLHRATTGPDDPGGPTPGPKVFDMDVSKATGGTVRGSFWITEEQVQDLKQGRYYVQIHSETNPAGQLRGWLFEGFFQSPADDSP